MVCQLSDENKRERVEGLGTDNMYQGSRHDAYSWLGFRHKKENKKNQLILLSNKIFCNE